jgi:putative membrane protein
MMDHYDYSNGSGDWGVMLLLMLLMVALVGVVVWLIVSRQTGTQRNAAPPEATGREPSAAQEILDARLARGEIDTAEYRERSDAIRGARGPSAP